MNHKPIVMIDLCIIRHGETEANRDEIRQGHCDYPLTEGGINDALKTGTALRHVKWSQVYASDLNRARTVSTEYFTRYNVNNNF